MDKVKLRVGIRAGVRLRLRLGLQHPIVPRNGQIPCAPNNDKARPDQTRQDKNLVRTRGGTCIRVRVVVKQIGS